jgi:hypothetical protein
MDVNVAKFGRELYRRFSKQPDGLAVVTSDGDGFFKYEVEIIE